MPAVTFGTAYLFGVNATIASCVVISDTLNKSKALTASVQNETGQIVHERDDDNLETRTLVLRIQSGYTVPTPSNTLSYRSSTWKINSVDDAQSNTDFEQVTVTVQKREYLAYA